MRLLVWTCAVLVLLAQARAETTWTEVRYDLIEEIVDTVVGNLGTDTQLSAKYGTDLSEVGFEFLQQQGEDYSRLFSIDPTSGVLKVVEAVDRDALCPNSDTCELKMDIGALGPDRDFLIIKVTINVIDTNDNAPSFPDRAIVIHISEGSSADAYPLPQASDPDSAAYTVQSYELIATTNKFSLRVTNNTDGTFDLSLILTERLDREEKARYSLQVVAKDGGRPPLTATLDIEVVVQDANDNKPEFLNKSYAVSLREDLPAGTSFLRVEARDSDTGPSGEVVYDFTKQTRDQHGSRFSIDEVTGDLTLLQSLDYEMVSLYLLQVTAHDKGPESETSTVKVTVTVQDVNDHAPEILVNALSATGNVEVPENSDPGTFVAHVSVKDQDSSSTGNGQVTCRLSDGPGDGPFQLEQIFQGVFQITTTRVLDRETRAQYLVNLECQDYGQPPLIANSEFVVTVLDENDHSPVFAPKLYTLEVDENNQVEQPLLTVTATDQDAGVNAEITYSINAAEVLPYVHVDPRSGEIFANAPLDYEKIQMLQFEVLARDGGVPLRSATASVIITIRDTNDEPPVFPQSSYDFATLENQEAGVEIGFVSATDKDTELPFKEIEYSFVQETPIFDIDRTSGKITSQRMLDREALANSAYHLVVLAENPGFPGLSSTVMVNVHVADVNDNAPTITFPNKVNRTAEVPFKAPRGFVFSRVLAEDPDSGENARLHYSIAKGNSDGLFDIDHISGALSVTRRVTSEFVGTHLLLVEVQDRGKPRRKSATADLSLVIDREVVYAGAQGVEEPGEQTSGGLQTHQTILIALGIITVLLVTALIAAIVCVKRRQYKAREAADPAKLYTADLSSSGSASECEAGTHLDVDSMTAAPGDADPASRRLQNGRWAPPGDGRRRPERNGGSGVNNIHNVQGTFVSRPNKLPCSRQAPHDASSRPLYDAAAPGSASGRPGGQQVGAYACGSAGRAPRHRITESPADVLTRPWALTQKELEVHELLQRMTTPVPTAAAASGRGGGVAGGEGAETDSASGCSVEAGSNTDSGRGASEDGEQNHQHDTDGSGNPTGRGRQPNRGAPALHRPPASSAASSAPHYTVQYTQPNVAGIHPANQRPPASHVLQGSPPLLPPRGMQSSYPAPPPPLAQPPRTKPQCQAHSMALQVPPRHQHGTKRRAGHPGGYNSLSRCTDTSTQDELSDGGSTTSGSYTLDMDDQLGTGRPPRKPFSDTFV